ncbi:MAG: flagellar filament capping protein FliD [Lachnospirales bacterium]
MAMFTSDINRVTGLSGLDTESMVEKMMKAESMKYNRLEKQKTSVTWQQESFRQLIKSMQGFQDKWFNTTNLSNNIGYDAFWNNYKTSVKDATTGADSNVIKVNSTTNSGRYDINVTQKAETETLTGQGISKEIVSSKTDDEIKTEIEKYGEVKFNVVLDGGTKEIAIKKDELANGQKIEDVLNKKLEDAFGKDKVKVSKDSNNKLKFKPNGDGHSLTITDSERTEGVSTEITNILKDTTNKFEITIDGYTATAKFDKSDTKEQRLSKIKEALKEAQNSNGEKKDLRNYISIEAKDDNLVIKNDSKNESLQIKTKVNDGLEEIKDLHPAGNLSIFGFENPTTVVKLNSKLTDVFGDKFNKLFKDKEDEIKLNFGGKEVSITKDDTIQTLINKVNNSGGKVNLEFNEVTNRFTLKSSESGANGTIDIKDQATKDFLKNITGIDVETKTNNAKYTQGQDAIFEIDGVQTTRPSNDISMNGINFTINGTGHVIIEANSDVDETFKKVKEFVEDYNKLIEEVNNAFVEKRPKSGKYGYFEPLTDEEKKGMSEDEIKKYEENAKKGLLNGDENINKFLSSLRSNIYKSVDIGGKTISLYEIGITTTKDYNDGGKLQIDEEKFKKALSEKGDDIRQLFTTKGGIVDNIKSSVESAIGSSGYLRKKAGVEGSTSASNNDLTKELEDITKRLADERERLYNKEMYYFDLFAKMESSMNQQNSQMAVLLGMSGQ